MAAAAAGHTAGAVWSRNGNQAHETDKSTRERFSFVFYSSSSWENASADTWKYLDDLGFVLPEDFQ